MSVDPPVLSMLKMALQQTKQCARLHVAPLLSCGILSVLELWSALLDARR